MGQLKGVGIDSYLISLINVKNWNEDVKDKTPVKSRSNNANSKWLKLSATSGRNPTFYKAITLISFLNEPTDSKEGIVLFRTMSSLGAGANSIAYKPSPGKWYLDNIVDGGGYDTCLLSEFYNSTKQLYEVEKIPYQLMEVAINFKKFDESIESALNFSRGLWGETYSDLMRYVKKIDVATGSNGGEQMLRGFDKKIKKKINKSKNIKFLKKTKKGINAAVAITNPEIMFAKIVTKKIVKRTIGNEVITRMGIDSGKKFTEIIDKNFSSTMIKKGGKTITKITNVDSIDDAIDKML